MTISFIHHGDPTWASYRYRAAMPAKVLGASLNDPTADVLIFSKPMPEDVRVADEARRDGRVVIVDLCDPHFERPEYLALVMRAQMITCPTEVMAQAISQWLRKDPPLSVIPEPYEFVEQAPHAERGDLLWFGHAVNRASYASAVQQLGPVRAVSNFAGAVPWSVPTLAAELTWAGIVVLPRTEDYKSANRAVEAIRAGCFVVAEPHPAIAEFDGIWIGSLSNGVSWARHDPDHANAWVRAAQTFVRQRFAPETIAAQWSRVIQMAPVMVA